MNHYPTRRKSILPTLMLAALGSGLGGLGSIYGGGYPTYTADTASSRGWWNEPQSEASIHIHKLAAEERRWRRNDRREMMDMRSAAKNPAWNPYRFTGPCRTPRKQRSR